MPLIAKLVYDGGSSIIIPDEMKPKEGMTKVEERRQMRGTVLEQLCEISGRVCYDSLGAGRDSAEYHKHILEVGHLSTIEHANVFVELEFGSTTPMWEAIFCLANRPGIIIRTREIEPLGDERLVISANLRAINDFDKWTNVLELQCDRDVLMAVKRALQFAGNKAAPQIVTSPDPYTHSDDITKIYLDVVPYHSSQQFVSMFLAGSRGFSHEMVRHRFNISQRSTRYCDESESEWVWHPLIEKLSDSVHKHQLNEAKAACQKAYDVTVDDLQKKLIATGVDKFTARKQARGAARGALGNALYTEMIFSAPVSAWKWMIGLRGTLAADAEIRIVFSQILAELKKSRYADQFANYELEPSSDGLGNVIVKKG